MDETQIRKHAAQDFGLLHICICICVTHQVYQYFFRKKVEDDSKSPPSGQFRYDPLHDRAQVRLFCLYPGEYHDAITGCLYTVTMEELQRTRYEAISYVWGDPHNKVGIRVESATESGIGILPITKNLKAALKRVRRRTLDCIIWADGICINQADILERGHQVRLMRSIYEQANLVHVWLGSGSRECTDMHARYVFKLLNSLAVKDEFGNNQRIAETHDIIWRHLSHVLNQPWFRRIWILQEIGVARAAIFYYGRARMDRNALYRACDLLATHIRHLPAITTLETSVTWIRSLETHFHFNGSKSDLTISKFDLFDLARPCAATDPRDMIFALMGHPIFDTDDGEDFLPIDYSHSREHVYTELALKLLQEPRNPLQLLSLVKHIGRQGLDHDCLPSWVPVWDVKSPMQTLGGRKRTFTASGSSQQAFTASVDGLCIQGYRVDTIEWQSQTLRRTDFPEDGEKLAMSLSWRSIIEAVIALAIAPGSTHLLSCARTFTAAGPCSKGKGTASFDPQKQRQDTIRMFAFVDFVNASMWREVACGADLTTRKTLEKIIARDYPYQRPQESPYSRGPWPFSLEARKWCIGRRFFITAKGLFGLGPSVSEVGDPIYILPGAAVPFVLRRNLASASSDSQDVHLCGECYVDGIMSGEGDHMLARGETCLENLHII